MQFSCRPHHRSVLARNLPCRVVPALFPPLRPSCHPFSLPLLSIIEGISRVSRSDFRDIRPRYFIHTHIYIYIYISVFKTGKWQNSGNSGATSVFCKISRGTKLSGMAITGSPGREIRRIPSTLRAPSRDEILRATYVFVTYVGWPRGPPMLDGETKRITPEGSEAPKPASFRFPFPYYPASRLLFTNSLSVFIEGPRPLPVISNLLQNAWHFFEGKTEKGKGRRSVIRRVKDRSRGIRLDWSVDRWRGNGAISIWNDFAIRGR